MVVDIRGYLKSSWGPLHNNVAIFWLCTGVDACLVSYWLHPGTAHFALHYFVVFFLRLTTEDKVRWAQQQGAAGVIIINNEPKGRIFAMGGSTNTERWYRIPAAMLSASDGAHLTNTVRAVRARGGTAKVRNCACCII